MNLEEIDKWLDNEYGISYTRLEELHDYFFEKYTDQKEEIERLNNLLKETSQILSKETIKAITLKSENKRLNNIINRIKSIYSSLCFSAPENNYIFIEQLGEILQELKGSDK